MYLELCGLSPDLMDEILKNNVCVLGEKKSGHLHRG